MNVPFVMGRGFSDPIFQSQAIFRLILQALSTPGVLLRVDTSSFEAPQGLSSAAAATLLAAIRPQLPVRKSARARVRSAESEVPAHWTRQDFYI